MVRCDFGSRKQAGAWCCVHGLWDKCAEELVRIFHSSFISWQIYLFTLPLAITDVCSTNESTGGFKASLIFRMKQREKSIYFLHGGWSSPLPKAEKETWDVVVQSRGEREPNISHNCGTDREAPDTVKSLVLTIPSNVAILHVEELPR